MEWPLSSTAADGEREIAAANHPQLRTINIPRLALARICCWASARWTSPTVLRPAAVRYAWADNPEGANLYNVEGFPASPFRSDAW